MNKKKLTTEERNQIIAKYNEGKTASEIASWFTFKRTTVSSVISLYRKTGRILASPRGGPRNVKLNDATRLSIKNMVDENACVTLRGIQRTLATNNIDVSKSTICRTLKKFHYTLKRTSIIPERRNDPRTIELRYEYAVAFMTLLEEVDDQLFLFIDEAGFCATMRACRGYSKRGEPAIVSSPGLRSRNVSLCAAISKIGVEKFETLLTPYNTMCYGQYMERLINELTAKNISRAVLIMDNVPFHRSTSIQNLISDSGHTLLYLPPYSPFLNPIENCFAKWKDFVKYAAPQNETMLMNLITESGNSITADDCSGYWRNMMRYIRRSLNRDIIND